MFIIAEEILTAAIHEQGVKRQAKEKHR